MSVRDIARAARRDLHHEAGIPALLLATRTSEPILVTVRLHKKETTPGQLPGSGGWGWAETFDVSPRAVFLLDEIGDPKSLLRGMILSVEIGEAYTLGASHEPEDITVAVEINTMPTAQTVGLPVPASGADPSVPANPYAHTFVMGRQFSFESALVWVVQHDLGHRPIVAVTLDSGEEIEAAPVHIDDNRLEIRFNRPRSGKVRCV